MHWSTIQKLRVEDSGDVRFQPEKKLLAGILARAFLDLSSNDGPIARESLGWICSKDTRDWSFIWVCEYLDLSAETLEKCISGSLQKFKEEKKLFQSVLKDKSQEKKAIWMRERRKGRRGGILNPISLAA